MGGGIEDSKFLLVSGRDEGMVGVMGVEDIVAVIVGFVSVFLFFGVFRIFFDLFFLLFKFCTLFLSDLLLFWGLWLLSFWEDDCDCDGKTGGKNGKGDELGVFFMLIWSWSCWISWSCKICCCCKL